MPPQGLQYTLEEARTFLEEGSLPVVDAICREMIDRNPAAAEAWGVLATVALRLGLPEHAREYAEKALAIDAGSASAREALAAAATLPPASRGGDRFLLIKAWANGFFSDLDHTLGQLLVAEMTGRTPVIHWGANSLFGGTEDHDAFRDFFEPVNHWRIGDLIGKGYDYFPPKWSDANLRQENFEKYQGEWSRVSALWFLARPERVVVADFHTGIHTLVSWLRPGDPYFGLSTEQVYRALLSKYVKLLPDIRQEIDSFATAKFATRPVIAAHARGSDKFKEDAQLEQKIGFYPQIIAKLAAGRWFTPVFLLTDASQVREQFARHFGPMLITTDCTRTATREGLHLQGFGDKRRLGVEVLKDAYLAAKCDAFVGLGSSNVSCIIYHLKEWPEEQRVLIGPIMTHQRNPYLSMNQAQMQRVFAP